MPHNYAADSTFQDVMARLAGTGATFAQVWPVLRPAILSGRAPTVDEYRPLNALIHEAHAKRIARNEALNAPHMHSKVGDVANSVGVEEEDEKPADAEAAPVQPTQITADHVEKTQREVQTPPPESEKPEPDGDKKAEEPKNELTDKLAAEENKKSG
ncbi:hypothetical protein [Komagataeibacter xylinus]|uniref:hypothetical protein n=1 Tax=Komagataeibacter xylinus TaxID=28448 RepID=UPI0019819306|nr:hypothetical protein [Komagataeibacter xylinus]